MTCITRSLSPAEFTDDLDPQHWKKNNPEMRNRMKRLQLAINYGMGVPSLAKGFNGHPLIASNIIEKHRRAYPRFWRWRDEMINAAMLRREMRSVFGWLLRISTSPNKRTLYNFPMQSNGAEMLQLAAWRMCEIGIIPCIFIHDGLLIEARGGERASRTGTDRDSPLLGLGGNAAYPCRTRGVSLADTQVMWD